MPREVKLGLASGGWEEAHLMIQGEAGHFRLMAQCVQRPWGARDTSIAEFG